MTMHLKPFDLCPILHTVFELGIRTLCLVEVPFARRSLAVLQSARPVGTSCVFRYSGTSALWLILQFRSHHCLHAAGWLQEAPRLVFGGNRGLGELPTSYPAEQGKTIFGTGIFSFGHGLIWFHSSSPGGIFILRPLNLFDAFFRAEIVIGAIVAAYGILVWRSASRKLSLANCILVSSCVPVLLLCASKLSEWFYFVDQQRGFLTLNVLAVAVTQITLVVCIVVFGIWWADSTHLHARFRRCMPSSRFVK
jgi:hypothetical protein